MMKKVGNCYYVHKSNKQELLDKFPDRKIRMGIFTVFNYDVIKFDSKANTVTVIKSPDWDIANEPTVGDSRKMDLNTGEVTYTKGRKENPQIYHHKWCFVADDYTGFDIEKAKERSRIWEKIPGLDKKKIGNQNYWYNILDSNGIER